MRMSPNNKELVLLSILVGLAFTFWLSVVSLLDAGSWDFSPLMVSAVIAGIGMLIVWGVVVLLVESTLRVIMAWAIVSFMGLLWIRNEIFMIGAGILFVFGVVAYFRGRYEIQYTLRGFTLPPLRRAIPLTVTFLVLHLAILSYLYSPTMGWGAGKILPEPAFERILGYIEPVIRKSYPAFESKLSFREYTIREASRALEPKKKLSSAEEAQLVALATERFRITYGFDMDPNTSLSHIFYIATLRILERGFASYQLLLPIAFSVGLFIAMRLLSLPIYWLAMGLAILCVRVLHSYGVVELRTVPTEIIVYTFP